MEPTPAKPYVCPEKQHLAYAFIEAVRNLMSLRDRELAALAAGDNGLARFEQELELARRKRDQARQLYNDHIRSHGC
jgi:hypothetical protein